MELVTTGSQLRIFTSSLRAPRLVISAFPRVSFGFTLIEMLVVVMLMGLIIGLVTVTARPDEKGILRLEADRLSRLLALAADEARLTGRHIRWSATDNGYRFLRQRKDGEWGEIRDNDTLRARSLPNGVTINGLRIDGRRQAVRQLEFVPYGSQQTFRIEMALNDEHAAVVASPVGEISVAGDANAAQ